MNIFANDRNPFGHRQVRLGQFQSGYGGETFGYGENSGYYGTQQAAQAQQAQESQASPGVQCYACTNGSDIRYVTAAQVGQLQGQGYRCQKTDPDACQGGMPMILPQSEGGYPAMPASEYGGYGGSPYAESGYGFSGRVPLSPGLGTRVFGR